MKRYSTIVILLLCKFCFGQTQKQYETLCDSIYINKGVKIIQIYYPEGIDSTNEYNLVFQLWKQTGKVQKLIYEDTISSQFGHIKFKDFNNDGIRDILIHYASDVRSNWHFHLYLVDATYNNLKKIKGFEQIKNPKYLPEYNLISNYVNSGTNWTGFYKIEGNNAVEYNITINDDMSDSGQYESDYKEAIKKILKNEIGKQILW